MSGTKEIKGRTWFERDYPVLLAAAKLLEASNLSLASTWDIARETGFEQADVVRAISNLRQKYVIAKEERSMTSTDYFVIGLTADGLVAADVWPSTETLAERLIAALETALDEAPAGSTKQTKIQAALSSLRELGVGGAGNVLGQAISTALGLV